MTSYNESKSLWEVRAWKELCRQEDAGLSDKERLEQIRTAAETVKSKYNILLQKVMLGENLTRQKPRTFSNTKSA